MVSPQKTAQGGLIPLDFQAVPQDAESRLPPVLHAEQERGAHQPHIDDSAQHSHGAEQGLQPPGVFGITGVNAHQGKLDKEENLPLVMGILPFKERVGCDAAGFLSNDLEESGEKHPCEPHCGGNVLQPGEAGPVQQRGQDAEVDGPRAQLEFCKTGDNAYSQNNLYSCQDIRQVKQPLKPIAAPPQRTGFDAVLSIRFH